jgi:hypothetical protein
MGFATSPPPSNEIRSAAADMRGSGSLPASWPTAPDGRTPEWKAKRAREKTLRRRSRHARERLAAGLVANGARRAHTRAESEAGEGKWGDRPDSNRYREAHNLGCSPLHHGHHERGRPDSNRQPLA